MSSEIKPDVSMGVFESLDIRVGRILAVEPAPDAIKPSYILRADFGKYGIRISVARLTQHSPDQLTGRQILGLLNVGRREVGGIVSEFLCLGVQYPGAASGEATIVTPLADAKIGGKLF